MAKISEAQDILKALGMPPAQQNEIAALTLLALLGLKPSDPWTSATRNRCSVTKGVMDFARDHWDRTYAANTREQVRRFVLHQFVQAQVAEYNPFEPNLPTNSPRAHYAISTAALAVMHTYGTSAWTASVKSFIGSVGSLQELYAKHRQMEMVQVRFPDGRAFHLSPGKHNEVQREIIEKFAPRFAPNARVLYLGDTAKKNIVRDDRAFTGLGLSLNDHDKLPDIVLYEKARNWLFLIEAVTSHGPVSPKRVHEIEALMQSATARPVYVSAFPDISEFKKWAAAIAWETEVWIAEIPDHMIHYNGDRFLGPR